MGATTTIRDRLTGPGGPFEVVRVDVDGQPMSVYRDRLANLREVALLAEGHGDREFLVHGDVRLTFTDFLATARRMAAGLRSVGVGPGDRVAVLSENNPEWCATFWATVGSGAILVGLNGWWTTDEILYGLADSGASVLVVDRKRFARIADHLDEIAAAHVFVVGAGPAELGAAGAHPKVRPIDALLAAGDHAWPDVAIGEADPAVIFYTSGTTGRPKGAVSTHGNMVANLQNTVFVLTLGQLTARAAAEAAAAAGGDLAPPVDPTTGRQPVSLFTSPLFHVSGCHSTLVVGLLAGMRLVMPVGRFTPEAALALIEAEQVMVWAAVPTMIWRTCEHPDRHRYDTSSVISVSFGGSPSADELQRRIRETFPNVKATTNAYGLTETSSVITTLSGDDALTRADSVGQPLPVVDLAIAGPDGAHLPPGRTGEIVVRGPMVMPGYWNRPDATAESIRDGWLHTGDIGHLSDDGYLYVTDRSKDMIIRGGENVYCTEIENRLVQHPAVADAAVIGVPHPELGEEVKAIVQVAPGETLTADEVRTWVGETLAAFKVPAHVDLTADPLPRNASGKLLKNVLRGHGEVSFAETM